jgi:hypothetical protein
VIKKSLEYIKAKKKTNMEEPRGKKIMEHIVIQNVPQEI